MEDDQFHIQRALKGDAKAYAGLVERYQHMVYTLCMKMLDHTGIAEEVAQDVFVKCFRSLSSYNGKARFSTWLYRITYNACVDELKRMKRHRTEDLQLAEHQMDADVAEELLESKDRKSIIGNAIQQLSKEDRMIVLLFYYEDMSIKEIGKVMDMTANNVKVKLFRCREKLAELLEDKLHTM